MTLEFHSFAHLEVLYLFRKVPTSLLLLVNVQTFLRYLILVVFNHLSMVINISIYGIGWLFPVISNLEIIMCEV